MISITHAMILAAGLGTRLRPLTERVPKPLVEVAGRSLIDRIADRLEEGGVARIVANSHHLGDQVAQWAAGRRLPPVTVSPEPDLLETGGGVKAALGLLGPAPFYVVNGDSLWLDGPRPALARLAAAWDDERMDALLLVISTPRANGYEGRGDFFVDPLGRARRRREREVASHAFIGVQILHPRLFADAPEGAFSLNRLYDRAAQDGRLHAVAHDGAWFHISTPADLADADAKLRQRHFVT
jgi:MurNAc alpha-1-phosphate uridylyltransferase